MQRQEAESMHNTWLIAKREYLERVRTKGFIIATVLIPLLMGALVFGSAYMGSKVQDLVAHRCRHQRLCSRH